MDMIHFVIKKNSKIIKDILKGLNAKDENKRKY